MRTTCSRFQTSSVRARRARSHPPAPTPYDAGPTTFYEAEGEVYVMRLAEDYATTTLEHVRGSEPLQPTFMVPGVVQGGLVRAR